MTLGEAIAKRMNHYLYKKGITLYRLSKDSGIPSSTLKNLYNKHTRSPSLSLVYKICAGLGVNILDFLNCDLFLNGKLELD